MRVLLTGSAGFVGSHLCEALTDANHTVYGIDNFETGRRDNWPSTIEMDICNRHLLYQYANEVTPELVVHCAASYKNPDRWHQDTQVNVEGAINVAAVARHHNAQIIYFQTVLPPISSYAISKIAGEYYLRISGQSLTVYRLASVYGPRNLSGPIPTFYKRIKAGETCTVVTGVTRDFVYVGDLVERVLTDLRANESSWHAYADVKVDIGTGIETSIELLPGMVGRSLGISPSVTMRERSVDDVPHYDMNPERLPNPMPIETGITQAVHWYEQNGVEETWTHLRIKT